MRLWHEKLLPYLDTQHLVSQHKECCALRGNGWGRKHATVQYVFNYPIEYLVVYHIRVMIAMHNRGYHYDTKWLDAHYRGQHCDRIASINDDLLFELSGRDIIFHEHDEDYLNECLKRLEEKGTPILCL